MTPPRTLNGLMSVEAFGVRVFIDLSDVSVERAAEVRELWASCDPRCEDPADASGAVLAVRDVDEESWTAEMTALSSSITRAALVARAGECLLFHAAAVADPHGVVSVFVAPSGTGKSTLAAAFAGSDYRYVSEEAVAVTRSGRVLSFPRPLSRRQRETSWKRPIAPHAAGLVPAQGLLRLGGLFVLERADEYGDPTVEQLSMLDALSRLVPEMSSVWRGSAPIASLVDVVSRAGGVRLVRYREARDLVDAFGPLVGPPSGTGGGARTRLEPLAPAGSRRRENETRELTLERVPPVDAARIDDAAVLLYEGRLSVLAHTGALIWEALDVARSVAEVATAVGAAGPSLRPLVVQRIDEMVGAGVLRPVPDGGDDTAALGRWQDFCRSQGEARGEPAPSATEDAAPSATVVAREADDRSPDGAVAVGSRRTPSST